MEPQPKRFKPAQTIDLTSLDLDSDDDIEITAVNTIQPPPKQAVPAQANIPSSSNGLLQQLQLQQQAAQARPQVPQPQIPQNSQTEGNIYNLENGLKLDDVLFRNYEDVERREIALKREIEQLKSQIAQHESQVLSLDQKSNGILAKKKLMEDIGFTFRSSGQIRQYNEEIHKVFSESKLKEQQVENFKVLTQKTERKYSSFIDNHKDVIVTLLDMGDYQARADYLRCKRELNSGTLSFQEKSTVNGKIGYYQKMATLARAARERNKLFQSNGSFNNRNGSGTRGFPTYEPDNELLVPSLNIYNDTEDLRSLLDSVHRIEKTKDDESPTPKDLRIHLLTHQKQGLKWMEGIEDDPKKRGGILADDMGLGKTIQAIALMLSHRPNYSSTPSSKTPGVAASVALAAMKKAQEAEDKEDSDDDLEILETSNKDKAQDAEYVLSDSDVDEGNDKQDLFQEQPQNEVIEDGAKVNKTNLIVCPVALMEQWKSEIETKVRDSANFKVMIFNSLKGKRITFKQLSRYDVVLISYQTLSSELKKHIHGLGLNAKLLDVPNMVKVNQKKLRSRNKLEYFSPFFEPEAVFRRVILDEAQIIKNKLTRSSIACSALVSKFRWCLSGTPMQNSIDELYPLIRFLRIKPYCEFVKFSVDIARPMDSKNKDYYDESDHEQAIKRVRVLLKAILFRREKDATINGKPILSLPGKEVIKHRIEMNQNSNEFSFYNSLEFKSAKEVQNIMNGPKAKGVYSSILALLLRLRQACIHSELVRIGERKKGIVYDEDGVARPARTLESMFALAKGLSKDTVARINNDEASDEKRFQCPICYGIPSDVDWMVASPCGHGMCAECVEPYFEKFQEGQHPEGFRQGKCTICRAQVKEDKFMTFDIFERAINKGQNLETIKIVYEKNKKEVKEIEEQPLEKLELSPKFKKALELIKEILASSPDEKVILFSEFTTMFGLFTKFLERSSINPLLYVGSMNSDARNKTVKTFYNDPSKRVMLISLRAGNVGLTLTCANHVILMDPFWNPYVEEQAQDRAYRIGQTKVVNVHRLLNANTVEDRIIQLQDKKKKIIESAMGSEGLQKASALGAGEIRFLFGLNDLEGAT
ncbi:hypothetical protein WICPIJ_008957 [Wickerhamomyces pijperi]|uniref:Uncharacterized protein n=1 Tax=Wickerhamomyces pijperi TaxID=599730 RepID=A0A9P8PU11_WICPI|nr:hypothetical protein WICPIJ_008957 [Wickerhamomyces pijperi]